jgi:hypothetical protein
VVSMPLYSLPHRDGVNSKSVVAPSMNTDNLGDCPFMGDGMVPTCQTIGVYVSHSNMSGLGPYLPVASIRR